MLAISQIEVAVKSFWGDLYHRVPKPEIGLKEKIGEYLSRNFNAM